MPVLINSDVAKCCFFIRFACSIELPEMFIVTGGSSKTIVSRYTSSGWMEDLPELNEGRSSHGCGYFYNDDMQRVSIDIQIKKKITFPANYTRTF